MINIVKSMKANSAISDMKIIKGNLYIIDSGFILYVYSCENITLTSKISLVKDGKSRHIYDNSSSLSRDFSVYLSQNDQNSGTLFLSNNEKIDKKEILSYHNKSVTTSTFSHNSELLAIGDEDGKVFFYNKEINKMIFSYPPRADAISRISFCESDRLVSVSSFDKTVIIYDIEANKEVMNFTVSDVVEDSLFLNDFSFFIGITRDKKIFNINTKTDDISYGNFDFDEWPTCILEINKNHLLVGTRENSLYLIDSHTLELSKKIEVENIGIKKLLIKENYLVVGYIDGNVQVIDLNSHLETFKIYLKKNNFTKATQLIDENIFLLTSQAVKKYDEVWEQVLEMAKTSINKKDTERALQIVSPFFFDKKKEIEYNFLNANKEVYARFDKLVDEENNVMAFKLVDEYSYLKDTKQYAVLEKRWIKIYNTCKLLFEKNDLDSTQKAIDTLTRYTSIASKKEGIDHLIKNYKFFIRAQKLVKSRNFKLYFKLTENKPFLTTEDLYNRVNQLGHNTYLKLLDLEKDGEFDKASTTARYLQNFTNFKQKASESLSLIEAKIELIENIELDDKHAVYNSVQKDAQLESFKDFMTYHDVYKTKKQESLQLAKKGDSYNVYQKLSPYLGIEYLIDSIGLIFKLSYISEMEHAQKMQSSTIHWSETIKQYVGSFGLDNEISAFLKENQLSDMIPNDTKLIKEKKFSDIEFLDTILVHK